MNSSTSRSYTPEELADQNVSPGDYFGTTSDIGGQVWRFDGTTAVRVGIPNPDHRSMATVGAGQTLRDALSTVPMFLGRDFLLHRMQLPPGAYYPRIARPSDQHSLEAPGALPEYWRSPDAFIGTLNQLRSLVGMLDSIFQTVHPVDLNMTCFGSGIRNLLILACTECEAQWRGILGANGYNNPKTTNDYVKIKSALRLSEYTVKLQHYPWIFRISPFQNWDSADPTRSIRWYDDYNAAKHDRESAFERASLGSAIQAVAAVWIMVAAQYGAHGMREFEDLNRYFHFEQTPLWRFSDVYTHPYPGFEADAGAQNFSF